MEKKGDKRNVMYTELDKMMVNADYERAIKTCNRLLHEKPDDELAFRCKIISSIHLSKIDEALSFMDKNPKLLGKLGFERAYCLYRKQDIIGAKNALEKCENSLGKSELMTQIHYRLEQYEEAYDGCLHVIDKAKDQYEEERQTNLAAINSYIMSSGLERRLDTVEYDTHELRYNMACALIAEDRFQDALKVLKEAEKQAVEDFMDDGLTEEEVLDETAIITIQAAYCTQRLGREREAMATYSRILKNHPPDNDLVAVASNNILCINKDQNIFESKKRIKAMKIDGPETKLTRAQRKSMHVNQCLFYLLTDQVDLCKDTCATTMSKFPETVGIVSLIETSLLFKTDGIDAAQKFVTPKLKSMSITSLDIGLCFVQQLLEKNQREQAIEILEGLVKESWRPGLVAALVTLYHSKERQKDIVAILQKAVDYYRKKEGNKERLNLLWRQAASVLYEQGDLPGAVKSLEELRKASPGDLRTVAQLIVAYAQYDFAKAKQLSSALPAVSPPEDLDMAVLESPNWLSSVKLMRKIKPDSNPSSPRIEVAETPVQAIDSKKKKKKGKCKSKMPAIIDPERHLDPERWLPKYERTGYRPKKQRSKGKVDVGKGTQGADSGAAAQFDMSAKVSNLKRETTSVPTSPNINSPKPKKSSKGKKGKSK